MDELLKDDRFKHISTDSRFKIMPKNQRKFKVDNRFKRMFHDKKFKLKYSVDKRGRPINTTTNENLKKFYELSSETESDNDEEKEEEEKKSTKKKKDAGKKIEKNKDEKETEKDVKQEIESSSESDEISEEDTKNISDVESKGESSEESESSDEESSNDEEEEQVEEIPWNEFDKDTIREDKISSRLAVCNMDWDRIKASDIFVLLNSFKPSDGVIKSVKIYLSEFGKQRIEYEKLHGPTELTSNLDSKQVISSENTKVENSITDEEDDENDDYNSNSEEEGSNFDRYKLRKYQFNRLKYYYAVVECDCAETANKIYTECDNMEYESSCTRLDLRFIPDDTTFDDAPTQVCLEAPDPISYKPDLFVTTALNQTKVECTWDETPRDRLALTMRTYTESDLKNSNFKNILATSSEEEDEESEPEQQKLEAAKKSDDAKNKIEEKSDEKDTENDRIKKYREILLGSGQKSKKAREADLEFSWEGGIEEEGFNDLLFNSKKKTNDKSNKYKSKNEDEFIDPKEQAQLSMLTMDNNDAKNHFNLDELMTDKTKKSKKKFGKKQDEEIGKKDDFKINIKDSRFEAMFVDHNFNIDPSNPLFKKTTAMETLIEEKLKRKSDKKEENKEDDSTLKKEKNSNNSEISLMVKAIKSKTDVLKRKSDLTNSNKNSKIKK